MLVFFIHGVATSNAKYAEDLKKQLDKNLRLKGETSFFCYSSFWGNVLKDVDKMWNLINQDLIALERQYPKANIDDIFRYRDFRQGFLADFVGDFLTYLNTERGLKIRLLISEQLDDFISKHLQEKDLHIISHSLGTVILYDILFSRKLDLDEPSRKIRSSIQGLSKSKEEARVVLKSITTMGSPILFFNTALGVHSGTLEVFSESYNNDPLRWVNILHASDVVAYPLRAFLNHNDSSSLFVRDRYLWQNANAQEKAMRTIGNDAGALALGAAQGHTCYWNDKKTAQMITYNLQGDREAIDSEDFSSFEKRIFAI